MLNICASFVTDRLIQRCVIPQSRKSVFVYGIELMLSTLLGMISIFIFSALLGNVLFGIVFLLVFVGLRLFSGGYHAKTYLRCFILSNFAFLLSYFISISLLQLDFSIVTWLLVILSITTIILFAPIRHKNHPLSEFTYARNKNVARVLAIVILFFFAAFFAFGEYPQITATIAASLVVVAGMMIIAVVEERRIRV